MSSVINYEAISSPQKTAGVWELIGRAIGHRRTARILGGAALCLPLATSGCPEGANPADDIEVIPVGATVRVVKHNAAKHAGGPGNYIVEYCPGEGAPEATIPSEPASTNDDCLLVRVRAESAQRAIGNEDLLSSGDPIITTGTLSGTLVR